MEGVEAGRMRFLLFWVTQCNWKWTVRVIVHVERKKFLCVKEDVFYPCLSHRETTKRKLAAVTETACSSKENFKKHSVCINQKREVVSIRDTYNAE